MKKLIALGLMALSMNTAFAADGGVVDQIGLKTNDAICDSPLVSNRHT
ncbi:hypothetical protein [Vibrio splendidus]|nr:hypothetical protein [Vibrio splendidus]